MYLCMCCGCWIVESQSSKGVLIIQAMHASFFLFSKGTSTTRTNAIELDLHAKDNKYNLNRRKTAKIKQIYIENCDNKRKKNTSKTEWIENTQPLTSIDGFSMQVKWLLFCVLLLLMLPAFCFQRCCNEQYYLQSKYRHTNAHNVLVVTCNCIAIWLACARFICQSYVRLSITSV